ncbi:MAG: ATP synthase F1 subunit delta [Ignavibacteriales bacterium]|nr:ATP synthase F1 subunit delta [Ignavibacteriales bacterium]
MSEFVISTRYANALMALSNEKNFFEKAVSEVTFIMNTLKDSKELRNFLASPIINSEKKSAVVTELFKSQVGGELNNYLQFLIAKGRENLLFDICKRFIELSNEKLNQVEVEITSAIELNETQKEEMKKKLEIMISKKVIPSFNVQKEIIGGFKARFDDTVIDASIHHQLEILKKKLFEENYLKN